MKRRTLLIGGAALAVALAAQGAGPIGHAADTTTPAGTAAGEPAAPVTITWWTGQIDSAATVLQGLVAEYTKTHPNVTVKVEQGASPDDMRSKLEVALGTDTYPDIAYVFGSDAAALSRSDKVVDLTEFVKRPEVNWEDFWGAERDAATIGGRVVAMPAVVGNLGIVYNKKLFAAEGLPEPTATWTWDDFRATAKALTDPQNKVFGTAFNASGTEGTVAPFWPMVWQQGLEILSADGKTVGFDSPKTVAALELLRAMAIDDQSLFVDQSGSAIESLFTNDKLGMMITGPWALSTLVEAKSEYGVQVLPGYDGNHETTGGQDLWMVFRHGTDDARAMAAAEFINWITLAEQDAKWSLEQFNLPIRATTKDQPQFTKTAAELPGYQQFVANLDNAKRARPPVRAYPEVSRVLGEQISAVLLGQADAATAIKNAVEQGNAALAEAAADA